MADFLSTHAKMLGVIAAIVIFGSWLVENTLLRRANDLKGSIQQAEADKVETERFHYVESKLLEVYQVAASSRQYAAESRMSGARTFKDDLYRDIEQLERSSVTLQFADAISRFGNRSETYISAISPPGQIAESVRSSLNSLRELRSALYAAREDYGKKQRSIVGETIRPDEVTEEQAKELKAAIWTYRDAVEFTLAPQLAPKANQVFRSFDDLFAHAREELAKRERWAAAAERIKITLFVVGSFLALLSSYLDASAPVKS